MKTITVYAKVFQQNMAGPAEFHYYDVEVELEDNVYQDLTAALDKVEDGILSCLDEFPGKEQIDAKVYAYLDEKGEGDSQDVNEDHEWYFYQIGEDFSDIDPIWLYHI